MEAQVKNNEDLVNEYNSCKKDLEELNEMYKNTDNELCEYKKKLDYSSFENLKQKGRVKFLNYADLEKQYKQELEKQELSFVL